MYTRGVKNNPLHVCIDFLYRYSENTAVGLYIKKSKKQEIAAVMLASAVIILSAKSRGILKSDVWPSLQCSSQFAPRHQQRLHRITRSWRTVVNSSVAIVRNKNRSRCKGKQNETNDRHVPGTPPPTPPVPFKPTHLKCTDTMTRKLRGELTRRRI